MVLRALWPTLHMLYRSTFNLTVSIIHFIVDSLMLKISNISLMTLFRVQNASRYTLESPFGVISQSTLTHTALGWA